MRSVDAHLIVDHLAAENSAQSLASFGGFTHFLVYEMAAVLSAQLNRTG
jgi:hypothetical protein